MGILFLLHKKRQSIDCLRLLTKSIFMDDLVHKDRLFHYGLQIPQYLLLRIAVLEICLKKQKDIIP